MRTRRTANPNQLALWGRYEMEALMTIKRSRPVAVVQVAPSLSKITLTVTKPTDRAPVFRCAANLVPIFQTSRSNTTDQLPGRLQAVGRPERTKTSENCRDMFSLVEACFSHQAAGHEIPTFTTSPSGSRCTPDRWPRSFEVMVNEQRTAADGKPVYQPGRAPDRLATRKQLAHGGLKPGGPPVAYLDIGAEGADLFDVGNVVPLDVDCVRIEMDRATAAVLYDALYGWGEHIAAGAPLPDFSSEDSTRLSRVINALHWHLRQRRVVDQPPGK